jgi:endonuclease/exonuclease/phosphatase family metal-dependent hydrolase
MALRLLVRTWNVFHGRTQPPSAHLQLERMVRLVTADAPDVLALQEVPLWAVRRLPEWSGMHCEWAMTMPALAGPIARRATEVNPIRFRSSLAGQANALLVNPHFGIGRHRRVVLNEGLSHLDWLLRARQRRVCHTLEVDARGTSVVLANLHASNIPDRVLVGGEIERAASFLGSAERCILCGDFNVRRHTVPGFTEPIEGIDQVLVRGLRLERGPERWPDERRSADGRLLSDHAPVDAIVAWT